MPAKTVYLGESPQSNSTIEDKEDIISIYIKRYATARKLHNLCIFVKLLSFILLAVALIARSNVYGDAKDEFLIMGIILFISSYCFSWILEAVASLLQTTIDSAVYQSPFISDPTKIRLIQSGGH